MKNPQSKNGRAIIYTRQDIRSLDLIKNTGRFINKREYIEQNYDDISDFFIWHYEWFVRQAEKKVSKPNDVEFPIWCSVSKDSCLKLIDDTVIYELDVDEREIFYFDGLKWDYILNNHYVPYDKNDLENYQKDMREKGFDNNFIIIDSHLESFYPIEAKRIYDSWENVFVIDRWDIFQVQANIWEIRTDMIKRIIVDEKDF